MSAQVELWRVNTIEGVFEADLETLKQWIVEGAVLPTDKVSKGNLNWIDAGRAPMLKAAFTAAPAGPPMQLVQAAPTDISEASNVANHTTANTLESFKPDAQPFFEAVACYNHPEESPRYVCRACTTVFCSECPRVVANTPLCPLCGELCKLYQELKTKAASVEFQSSGFGMEDFGRAIRYPFQHKAALLFGALMYAFLLMLGFRAGLIAYVIMFGCMSHVICQVAWGRLNRSFMPDFSSFSVLDDLVVPIFLGIGITIVTWGPVIALTAILFFGVIGGTAVSPSASLEVESAEQTGPSQDDLAVLTDPNADPEKLEAANKKLNETRPANQITAEAERSKTQEDPASALRMMLPYFGAGILWLLLFLAALAWAIFYYPMALTVAGYTQSFGSVINPLVGLDTIRRMGSTYFKAFGMVVLVQVVALVLGSIVAHLTSPLALPFLGNLPARFIDGTLTFYFNLVIACLLGLSLYKCADRLDISVD